MRIEQVLIDFFSFFLSFFRVFFLSHRSALLVHILPSGYRFQSQNPQYVWVSIRVWRCRDKKRKKNRAKQNSMLYTFFSQMRTLIKAPFVSFVCEREYECVLEINGWLHVSQHRKTGIQMPYVCNVYTLCHERMAALNVWPMNWFESVFVRTHSHNE